jgi:hypothetical protein
LKLATSLAGTGDTRQTVAPTRDLEGAGIDEGVDLHELMRGALPSADRVVAS